MSDGQEFDCCECGCHIIAFGDPRIPPLCGFCLFLPGWFNEPVLVAVFDPEHDRTIGDRT